MIMEVMIKARKSITYKFPCALLVSRFIDHFKVDVTNEVKDNTLIDSEIASKNLAKIGVVETIDGTWLMASQMAVNEAEMSEHEEAETVAPSPAPITSEPSTAFPPSQQALLHRQEWLRVQSHHLQLFRHCN